MLGRPWLNEVISEGSSGRSNVVLRHPVEHCQCHPKRGKPQSPLNDVSAWRPTKLREPALYSAC
jgi:hypothetical protein